MSRHAPRIALLVALASGCGLTVAGSLERELGTGQDAGADANLDALARADAEPGDVNVSMGDGSPEGEAPSDAGLDVNPANCLAKCGDGGTCDGGWCTFSCPTGQCQNKPVVCPAGVPCAVDCSGSSACNLGVDCTQATACAIGCTGPSSCTNGAVRCSGASCSLSCAGNSACNNGVTCDAGTCAIQCTGPSSCTNAEVQCRSKDCIVACGDGTGAGNSACNLGVSCIASQSCNIACDDPSTCTNKRIVAIAGARADVRCAGNSSCNLGVTESAADGGVFCKQNSCGPGIFCDGGTCNLHCDTDNVDYCCKAASCTKTEDNGCTLDNKCL